MNKLLTSGLMLMFCVGIADAAYKNLAILDKSGTEQEILVSYIQKLTFDNSNMNVNFVGDTTRTYSLESINKLYFKKFLSVGDEQNESKYELAIYPNPATESISIKGIKCFPTQCAVYDVAGNKLKTIELTYEAQPIPIDDFRVGVYFIKINNQIRKFEKYEK